MLSYNHNNSGVSKSIDIRKTISQRENEDKMEKRCEYGYSRPNIPLGNTPPQKDYYMQLLLQKKVYDNYIEKSLNYLNKI